MNLAKRNRHLLMLLTFNLLLLFSNSQLMANSISPYGELDLADSDEILIEKDIMDVGESHANDLNKGHHQLGKIFLKEKINKRHLVNSAHNIAKALDSTDGGYTKKVKKIKMEDLTVRAPKEVVEGSAPLFR